MGAWFDQDVESVLAELDVAAEGLSEAEAARRRRVHGRNELHEQDGRSPLRILIEQLESPLVLLLIGAAVVSGLVLGEHEDAIVIGVVVILNAVLGFRQEYRAEQAMAALKKLTRPSVRVRRDGSETEVPSSELVPGDVVHMEAGNLVPADCRLLEAANLRVQEAALTGEAEPVEKCCEALAQPDLAVGDRVNMAYMGTVITYGRALGVVTATGMATELGRIATMIQEAEKEDTVLQRKLAQLSKVLVAGAFLLIGVVAVEAWLILHMPMKQVFMTAVSMAVAAIPEGLPAVVTISLALGAQRMLKRRALIRRLPAVETLGSVTVICSDKTGTLTQNRMTVTTVVLAEDQFELAADDGERRRQLAAATAGNHAVGLVLAGGALCSDAVLKENGAGDEPQVLGDPTEGAFVTAAAWCGWGKSELEEELPRVHELPFDSDRKRMTTVHGVTGLDGESVAAWVPTLGTWVRNEGHDSVAFVKGSVDRLLPCSNRVWLRAGEQALSEEQRDALLQANEDLSAKGIRVLGVAMRSVDSSRIDDAALETDLVFLGMVGMLDPLRPEVKLAVQTCHGAGIRPVMITGDHPLIASNIGSELGLHSSGGFRAGRQLETMSRSELEQDVHDVSIYARVAPEHKLRIVDAFQKNGEIVAMTGDGVNDAPALKEADIGVAMGITGTDVSKEAADMVLQDDNFATIVDAVEQGRVILDNIIRFVRFILASNSAEILVMLFAPLCRMPIPLFPVQILWMNLVTDGLPALALGVEPGESNVMRRPPRSPQAPIIDRSTLLHILFVGGLMAVLALGVGWAFFDGSAGHAAAGGGVHGGHGMTASTWQTMLFTVLVFAQLTLAFAERSTYDSVWKVGLRSNPHMIVAVGATIVLQLAVVYVPVLQRFFRTTALSAGQLGLCALLSLVVLAAVEIKKLLVRQRRVARRADV